MCLQGPVGFASRNRYRHTDLKRWPAVRAAARARRLPSAGHTDWHAAAEPGEERARSCWWFST